VPVRLARPWPPLAAAVLLVVLLVVAASVDGGQRPMWITPGTARPGQAVTVHFQVPQPNPSTLTVEHGTRTWLVQNGDWQEVDMGDGFYVGYVGLSSPGSEDSSTTLTLPTSIEGGSYQVCTLPLEDVAASCASVKVS